MEGLSAYGSDDDDNQHQSITPGNSTTSTTTTTHDIPLETTTMNCEGLPVAKASTHGRESDRKVQGQPFKKFKTGDPVTTSPHYHRQVDRMDMTDDIRHGNKQDAGDFDWKKLPIPIWTEEEARKHEIFVRNEPHVRGNWAGLVYLRIRDNRHSSDTDDEDEEWERDRELQWDRWNQESYHQILCQSSSLTGSPKKGDREPSSSSSMPPCLVWHDEPHISLTRTFYVQAANIPSFLQHLQQRIATWATPQRLELHQRPLIKLVNDEQSRSFWAWPVVACKGPSHHDDVNGESNSRCHDTTASPRWLTQWVHDLDDLLQNYQQPPYYDPPTFHASFASYPLVHNTKKSHKAHHSLGHRNKRKEPLDKGQHNQMPFVAAVTRDRKKDGKEWRSAATSASSATWEFEVTHVYCRIGHDVHCFALEEPLKPR